MERRASAAPARRWIVALVLLVLPVVTVAGVRSAAATRPESTTGSPVRILVLGDSISTSGAWQAELTRLLASGGVANELHTAAVGATPCAYWVDKVSVLLRTYHPDLVVLECGTNDDPNQLAYGEPLTGWAFRSIVEAVHAARPADPILVLPMLIQYSDPLVTPSWLWQANEPRVNDLLWTNMQVYRTPWRVPWFAGIVDLQRVPAAPAFVMDDGIHPTPRGQRVIGRLVYDAAAARMGWPAIAAPGPCDLYGHRVGYPRPSFTPCPEL